jgi:hypothetical protein
LAIRCTLAVLSGESVGLIERDVWLILCDLRSVGERNRRGAESPPISRHTRHTRHSGSQLSVSKSFTAVTRFTTSPDFGVTQLQVRVTASPITMSVAPCLRVIADGDELLASKIVEGKHRDPLERGFP